MIWLRFKVVGPHPSSPLSIQYLYRRLFLPVFVLAARTTLSEALFLAFTQPLTAPDIIVRSICHLPFPNESICARSIVEEEGLGQVVCVVPLDIQDDEQARPVSIHRFCLTLSSLCSGSSPWGFACDCKICPFFPFLSFPFCHPHTPSTLLTSQRATTILYRISFPSSLCAAHHKMAPSSDHTIEETTKAYSHLHLQPHERISPNIVPRSAHTHASQQAVNVPSP